MSKEKRIAGDFEIIHAVQIGDDEIVLGEEFQNKDEPTYMCALCQSFLGFDYYNEVLTSEDYLEIVEIYGQRLVAKARQLQQEQQMADPSANEALTEDDCRYADYSVDLKGKVLVIKSSSLRPEYRRAIHQLVFCTGGFGASAQGRGSAVFCTNIYTGENERFERSDVLGTVDPDNLSEWAKSGLLRIIETERSKSNKDAIVKYCETFQGEQRKADRGEER